MKPYVETIPGTEISFEMLPIPGGTFTMGSPDDEPDRLEHEGPQHPVAIAPFWMGKHEVTWDEYDEFAFSFDLKRKEREGIAADSQPEGERMADAITRPTPPYADETFGMGREGQPVICITHHSAMEYCRWLSDQDRPHLSIADRGRVGVCLPSRHHHRLSLRRRPGHARGLRLVLRELRGSPARRHQEAQSLGPLRYAWQRLQSGSLDHYVANLYDLMPRDHPADNPVVLPSEYEYPYVARGGSWDFDPWDCRSASRHFSKLDWSVQDPQRPQSVWWHTDATFVGFRIVRALEERPALVGLKSTTIKGKGPKPDEANKDETEGQ